MLLSKVHFNKIFLLVFTVNSLFLGLPKASAQNGITGSTNNVALQKFNELKQEKHAALLAKYQNSVQSKIITLHREIDLALVEISQSLVESLPMQQRNSLAFSELFKIAETHISSNLSAGARLGQILNVQIPSMIKSMSKEESYVFQFELSQLLNDLVKPNQKSQQHGSRLVIGVSDLVTKLSNRTDGYIMYAPFIISLLLGIVISVKGARGGEANIPEDMLAAFIVVPAVTAFGTLVSLLLMHLFRKLNLTAQEDVLRSMVNQSLLSHQKTFSKNVENLLFELTQESYLASIRNEK